MNELFLHIGLHKTGTTHLESIFYANREALRAAGIGFIRTGEHRKFALEQRLGSVGSLILNQGPTGQEAAKLAERLAMPKLLVSDENIIGLCGVFSKNGLPYASLSANLRRTMRGIGRKRRVHVWLSLRNYADWLESCYLQTLKRNAFDGFDGFLEKADPAKLSWPDLVREVRRSLPEATLLIWPYETYRADSAPVIDTIEQEIGAKLEIRTNDDRNPSFSDLARLVLDATQGRYRTAQDLQKMQRFLKKEFGSASGYGRAPLFDSATRASLTAKYQRDWAEVAAMADAGLRCLGTVAGAPTGPGALPAADGHGGLVGRVTGWLRSGRDA